MMNKMKETKEIEEGRTNLRIRTEDKKAEENKAIDKAKKTDSITRTGRGTSGGQVGDKWGWEGGGEQHYREVFVSV